MPVSGTTLTLPPDSYIPPSEKDLTDLTAGAVLVMPQTPLPSSLAGTVYHDQNLDHLLDNNEQGIANVTLTLLAVGRQPIGSAPERPPPPTPTATTSSTIFCPAPIAWPKRSPTAGSASAASPAPSMASVDGTSTDVDTLSDAVLLGGQDGIHYNFGECLPASIAGKVWYDPENDCMFGVQRRAAARRADRSA